MKIKNNLPVLVLLALTLGLTACHKKNNDFRYDNRFALAVGNSWIYEESYFYPDTASTPNGVREVKLEVIKDTIIEDGQQAYIIEQSTTNAPGTSQSLRYQVNGELRERALNSIVYTVLFKDNMEVGMEWIYVPGSNNPDFNIRKVARFEPNFAFLSTTANVFEVQNGNPDFKEPGQYGDLTTEIFAPGIGAIEQHYYVNYFGPSRTQRILKAFTIQ